jgi:hypothetical protein
MGRVSCGSHRTAWRTAVHLVLVVTVLASLVLEPVLMAHIGVGLIFTGLVVAHLSQRRRTVRGLLGRLPRLTRTRSGRLAVADLWLALLTVAMLVSGLVDWALGHPTRIRWHAITGVILAAALLVHTIRRRRRLRGSVVQ